MIFLKKPENFNPAKENVGCFVEYDGEIILLHRQDFRPEGDTWGLPAGKIEKGEELSVSIAREIAEETGLKIPVEKIEYLNKVYVKYPDYDQIFHVFHTRLDNKESVTTNPDEHKDYKWISPQEALDLPLIRDLKAVIKLFYKI
jgi:8-oxo-dGTP diphosphatase